MRCLSLLVIVCACGDNLTGTPFDELEVEANRARCERFVRCGLFAEEATCTSFFRKRPDVNLHAAIAAGIVRYDGPSAERCHRELAALTCDTSAREARVRSLACEQMFAGTLPAGAACRLGEECRSGACEVPACPEACCTGTCRAARAFAELDAACTLDDDCVDDAYCGDDLVCHPLVTTGGSCESDCECEFHLGCIGATPLMAGNCRELPLVGEPCPYLRCAELGATCQAGRCIALGLPGAPCASGADCSPFAQCDAAANRCVDTPRLAEPCTARCAGEAWCDFMGLGMCTAPQPNGAPCGSDDQCLSLDCVEGPAFDSCADRPLCF